MTNSAARPTVTLPDGYNGDTEIFYADPIAVDGSLVKLQCANPDKSYMTRWALRDDIRPAIIPALPDSGYYCGTLQVVHGYTLTLGSCLSREGALALLKNWYLANLMPYNHSRADLALHPAFYDGEPLDYSNEPWLAWWKDQPAGSRSERGSARVDYGFILFLFFILAILCFVAIDFLPIAARVPSAEIPVANFDKFNSLFHLW
jgi:hypothetical protein